VHVVVRVWIVHVVVRIACTLLCWPAFCCRRVFVTPTQVWQIDVGECSSFKEDYIRSSSDFFLVWVYIAAVWVVVLLIGAAVGLVVRWHERDVALRVALAKHAER
jgi:hypothetical protein